MESLEFVVFHTGYDERLTEIITQDATSHDWSESVEQALGDTVTKYIPVCFPSVYDPDKDYTDPYIFDGALYNRLEELLDKDCTKREKDILLKDSACFLYPKQEKNLCDIIHMLTPVEYCNFREVDSIYFKGNGSVLVIKMDCESGDH